uniref:Uncharacterized protein n=1 Tax=Rhizophora mucronata TaxID=61149 RepID=A0A2P2QTD2_RHIMU
MLQITTLNTDPVTWVKKQQQ